MNKLTRTAIFVLLLSVMVLELLALSVPAKSPDLDRVYANNDGTWYINAKTMVNPAGEKASFWSTVVPKKEGAYYEVLGMVLEKRGKDPRRLEYIQILQEVDCSMGSISSSNVMFYDKQDHIVHTVNSRESAKLISEFGQAADNLLATVCGQHVASLTGD